MGGEFTVCEGFSGYQRCQDELDEGCGHSASQLSAGYPAVPVHSIDRHVPADLGKLSSAADVEPGPTIWILATHTVASRNGACRESL